MPTSQRVSRGFHRLAFFLAFTASPSLLSAHDVRVEMATALDGKVECHAHTNWFITTASGPCDTFTPPSKVAFVKKGEWTCVAAESPEDIPSDENQDRNITWLFIRKCQPDNAAIPSTMDR